jgi:glycosyltransferase involved in cell wall biosynthesis
MQLLFVTNFYPPASRGGYEQWCQEAAEGLRARGHEVVVLTSRHGRASLTQPDPEWIYRELHLEMELVSLRNGIQFFTSRSAREKENLAWLRRLMADFTPDAVLIWGMWNLPRSLAALAEALLPGRVAYYMGDYWPTLPSQYEYYWQSAPRNWATAAPKMVLGFLARRILALEKRPNLQLAHVLFPTEFMRAEFNRRHISMGQTAVIYGAADTAPFVSANGSKRVHLDDFLTLLYVGRLTTEKGVHTAIEALGCLVHSRGLKQLKLIIVGSGEPDYEAHLYYLVQQQNLAPFVTFLGAQPKESLPELYHQADIFLFTSIWPEPFGRVLVEAMAAGIAVVGTTTGGAAEILTENENALTFAPGDAAGLANQIVRLVESPSLRQRLIAAGKQIALTRFDVCRMTEEIETYLQMLANRS